MSMIGLCSLAKTVSMRRRYAHTITDMRNMMDACNRIAASRPSPAPIEGESRDWEAKVVSALEVLRNIAEFLLQSAENDRE